MTSAILLQTLASGVLIGLIYALVAVGLTLIFGVMNIVNFSHGEFLMLGMYAAFWMWALLALDPLWTLPLSAIGLFVVGAAVYRLAIPRVLRRPAASHGFTALRPTLPPRGDAPFLLVA